MFLDFHLILLHHLLLILLITRFRQFKGILRSVHPRELQLQENSRMALVDHQWHKVVHSVCNFIGDHQSRVEEAFLVPLVHFFGREFSLDFALVVKVVPDFQIDIIWNQLRKQIFLCQRRLDPRRHTLR